MWLSFPLHDFLDGLLIASTGVKFGFELSSWDWFSSTQSVVQAFIQFDSVYLLLPAILMSENIQTTTAC